MYHEQPAQDVAPHALPRSLDFHLLFFVSFAAIGAGLALLDNFPQLLQSIAPRDASGAAVLPPDLDKSLLIVFSVANTLGRIAAGFGPEHALHKWVRQSSRAQSDQQCLFLLVHAPHAFMIPSRCTWGTGHHSSG